MASEVVGFPAFSSSSSSSSSFAAAVAVASSPPTVFLRQLEEVSLRDPVLEYFSSPSTPAGWFSLNPGYSSTDAPGEDSRLTTAAAAVGAPVNDRGGRGTRHATTTSSPASPGELAAGAPARFVCALFQKALNSNGCKYRLPYTNLPAGR